MMNFRTSILAAVASLGMIGAASAAPIVGQISLGGFAEAVGSVGMGSATGIDFANNTGSSVSGTSGTINNFGAGSGSFAGLSCITGTCGTIKDIASFAASAPISQFLTLTTSGPSISFDLSSLSNVVHMPSTDSLSFTATGIIHFSGLDDTAGTFFLTAQGDNITSFSATTLSAGTPTPEPASLAILGGSLAALGLLRRKKV